MNELVGPCGFAETILSATLGGRVAGSCVGSGVQSALRCGSYASTAKTRRSASNGVWERQPTGAAAGDDAYGRDGSAAFCRSSMGSWAVATSDCECC